MGEGMDEVVVIPGAFLDAMADGDFVIVGDLKDVSGEAVNERDVGGRIVLAGSAQILVKMHVEHPVQGVFDLPMRSGEVERLLRGEHGGGHEQARQRLGLIASAGDADEGLVARNQRLVRRHDLGPPPLSTAMAGLALLGARERRGGQMLGGAAQPMTAVALQGKQVIAAALNDARGKADAAANEQMKSMTEGLPLPPGFKMPF